MNIFAKLPEGGSRSIEAVPIKPSGHVERWTMFCAREIAGTVQGYTADNWTVSVILSASMSPYKRGVDNHPNSFFQWVVYGDAYVQISVVRETPSSVLLIDVPPLDVCSEDELIVIASHFGYEVEQSRSGACFGPIGRLPSTRADKVYQSILARIFDESAPDRADRGW